MRVHLTCLTCSAAFTRQPSEVGERNYCSRACSDAKPPRHTTSLAGRLWARVDKSGPLPEEHPEYGPCWIWTGATDGGWGYGKISAGKTGYSRRTHHVAWELATGNPVPADRIIGHVCDRPSCTRNDGEGFYYVAGVAYERHGHLWLATGQANAADRDAKGRSRGFGITDGGPPVGERNPRALLTATTVEEIRRRYRLGGISQEQLGREYGVKQTQVSRIIRGVRWHQD